MHQMQNIFKSSAKPICIYMLMYMLLHVYTYINVNAYHRRGEKRSYEALFPAPLNHSGFVEQTKKHEHFWSLRHCRKSKQETLEEVHPSRWCPVNLNHTDCILQPKSDEFWPMNWTPNPTTSKLIWQRNLERCRWVWRSQVQRWLQQRRASNDANFLLSCLPKSEMNFRHILCWTGQQGGCKGLLLCLGVDAKVVLKYFIDKFRASAPGLALLATWHSFCSLL